MNIHTPLLPPPYEPTKAEVKAGKKRLKAHRLRRKRKRKHVEMLLKKLNTKMANFGPGDTGTKEFHNTRIRQRAMSEKLKDLSV